MPTSMGAQRPIARTIVTQTGASVVEVYPGRSDHRAPIRLPTIHVMAQTRSGLTDADAGLVGIDARRGDLGTGHGLADYRRTG